MIFLDQNIIIAAELLSGYNDICNFSKQFKSIYNRSPTAYRKYLSVHSNVVWTFEHSPGNNEYTIIYCWISRYSLVW